MTALRWFFACAFTANGLWMLAAPLNWFTTVPGVVDSGPFNDHFVRDVGIVYALSGVAFLQLARGIEGARPYAMPVAIWSRLSSVCGPSPICALICRRSCCCHWLRPGQCGVD